MWFPPGVEEVVVAEHVRARFARRGKRRGPVLDDETDVPRAVRRLLPARRQRDELVAQIDERHRVAVAPTQGEVEDPSVEGERLLEVADLQRDVVDPDRARHRRQASRGRRSAGGGLGDVQLGRRRLNRRDAAGALGITSLACLPLDHLCPCTARPEAERP